MMDEQVSQAIQQLSFARDLEEVAALVRRFARLLTGADGVTFVLRDLDQCYYVEEDAIAPLWKGRRFPMELCIPGWVMLHKEPAVIPDIYADDRILQDAYRETFVKSLAMVPVRPDDPIAAIGSYWAAPHAATEAEMHMMQSLANATALALANVKLYGDLRNALASEREARLAAESASRMKDEFLANLSHELRTPLNVIYGWLWQLKQQTLSPDVLRRAVDVIQRNVLLQTRLVEDLLDASRAMTGKLKLENRHVELAGICKVVVDLARPNAESKRVLLRLTQNQSPPVVWGDPDRLQQILWNLVNNAIKFTPEGGEIEVTVTRANNCARFQVRDTGIGIPADVLPRVFDRFTQADSSSTRRHSGLGLGLTIVRQLVELHGGSVSAYSEGPGRGTTIKVELPIPAVLEEPGSWLRRRTGVPQAVGRLDGLDILVVDDESEACEAVRAILEQYGARVAVATSASEALAKVAQDPPDVLLADIAMPGTDGCELMRRIRALDSAARTIPAAALSAYGTEHLQRAVEAGYQLFLSKPIAAEELATSLLKLVAKHRSEGHA